MWNENKKAQMSGRYAIVMTFLFLLLLFGGLIPLLASPFTSVTTQDNTNMTSGQSWLPSGVNDYLNNIGSLYPTWFLTPLLLVLAILLILFVISLIPTYGS